MRFHLLVVALIGLACAAFAQEPRELTLDEHIDALPPMGCERHLDSLDHEWLWHPSAYVLSETVARGKLTDEQWRRALLKSGAIRWRQRWPADEPFLVSVDLPDWTGGMRLSLTPRDSELASAVAGTLTPGFCFSGHLAARDWGHLLTLGPLEPGTRSVACDIAIETLDEAWFGATDVKPRVVWSGSLDLPVQLVPPNDTPLVAVASAELERAVRDSLSFSVTDDYDADHDAFYPCVSAWLRVEPRAHAELVPLALALDFELLHDGVVVASQLAILDTQPVFAHGPHPGAAAPVELVIDASLGRLPESAVTDIAERARWSLRVRGGRRGAAAVFHAAKYWKGEFTLPLAGALETYQREREER
ncbi:MAG: hypothetical protein HZA52_18185 [Planctomycetes bacterium]|nr:hypothetical protein [Planctomycetota bacterium]